MIKILDNFLDYNLLNYITSEVLDKDFPWFFSDGKSYERDGHIQFQHTFYINNNINSVYYKSIALPILKKLNFKYVLKAKINITPKDKEITKYLLHNDVDIECNTAILYLNDNNGKTVFENGEEVNSLKNRMVIFPSSLRHGGTTHTNSNYRSLINLNYI
jgi:hypothetical protein|tara:strand:- start:520 stop:999 length:480 start_codon:yes stop_codon:yes gene_type:complete